jgi:hypothetical protein
MSAAICGTIPKTRMSLRSSGLRLQHCEKRTPNLVIARSEATTTAEARRTKAEESRLYYLPGRSSRLSNPAAMLTPTWPCTLSGCSAIEFAEPPTSTLPPTPTPSVALPCAPT